MEVLLVTEQNEMREALKNILYQSMSDVSVTCFTDPLLAVKYVNNKKVDWVFSSFLLKVIDGIQMMKMIHQLKPEIKEVLIGQEEQHRKDVVNVDLFYLNYPFSSKSICALFGRDYCKERENLQELMWKWQSKQQTDWE